MLTLRSLRAARGPRLHTTVQPRLLQFYIFFPPFSPSQAWIWCTGSLIRFGGPGTLVASTLFTSGCVLPHGLMWRVWIWEGYLRCCLHIDQINLAHANALLSNKHWRTPLFNYTSNYILFYLLLLGVANLQTNTHYRFRSSTVPKKLGDISLTPPTTTPTSYFSPDSSHPWQSINEITNPKCSLVQATSYFVPSPEW